MIAEILPDQYDVEGRKVFRPDSRRNSGFCPTFPAGRYLSQPLKYWCTDFDDIRRFLASCTYMSDREQFGRQDFWQPPEQFEEGKKGDCEDFALWCWRQLLHMNYPARFVIGTAGRYGAGHAWVTFQKDGSTFLLEPLKSPFGLRMPRLSTLRYHPKFSVGWNGETISYYSHKDRRFKQPLAATTRLAGEWIFLWVSIWSELILKLVKAVGLKLLGARGLPAP